VLKHWYIVGQGEVQSFVKDTGGALVLGKRFQTQKLKKKLNEMTS